MLCSLFGFWCDQIDAFYYPNKSDLSQYEVHRDVGSVDECRRLVNNAAFNNGDPGLRRGDYECGIGPTGMLGDITVYKETVK